MRVRVGSLGDCCVVGVMSVLASEAPHYIRSMFVTGGVEASGKYTMRLYSEGSEKIVEVDDHFPCHPHTVLLHHQ